MASSHTNEATQSVTPVIGAFIRFAEENAVLVGVFLRHFLRPLRLKKPPALPSSFLMELGAILRLRGWQRAGCSVDEFPPWETLLDQLVRQLISNPESFNIEIPPPFSPLNQQVFHFWFSHSAWNSLSVVGVEVTISRGEDSSSLELLADFLWRHRHLAE